MKAVIQVKEPQFRSSNLFLQFFIITASILIYKDGKI